jgi:hypothetical protein
MAKKKRPPGRQELFTYSRTNPTPTEAYIVELLQFLGRRGTRLWLQVYGVPMKVSSPTLTKLARIHGVELLDGRRPRIPKSALLGPLSQLSAVTKSLSEKILEIKSNEDILQIQHDLSRVDELLNVLRSD